MRCSLHIVDGRKTYDRIPCDSISEARTVATQKFCVVNGLVYHIEQKVQGRLVRIATMRDGRWSDT